VNFTGEVECPHCGEQKLRLKGRRVRRPRHESWAPSGFVAVSARSTSMVSAAVAWGGGKPGQYPHILGIDEHFFTRRYGYATTFCDLKNHKVHDVVLGRSEASLEGYLARLEGKEWVELVCMDLAPGYRALVRKHFPRARIVADRFHVIRTVNHHLRACWNQLDPVGARNRGLISFMRRHRYNLSMEQYQRLAAYLKHRPALESIPGGVLQN